MLEPLLGSTNAERVLVFILARNEGYAREIARFFDADADSIQKQLARLESSGVFGFLLRERTRVASDEQAKAEGKHEEFSRVKNRLTGRADR